LYSSSSAPNRDLGAAEKRRKVRK